MNDLGSFFNIIKYDTVSSTNTLLKEAAKEGAPEGTVYVAKHQTEGHGRLGRRFYSPENTGLYMSVLLRPSLTAEDVTLITTAAATAVAEALEAVLGEEVGIKWVNDIFYKSRKVCGILVEGEVSHGDVSPDSFSGNNSQKTSQEIRPRDSLPALSYAILGIGVNLTDPAGGYPDEIKDTAGSLFCSKTCDADTYDLIVSGILSNFYKYYCALPSKAFLDEYRQRSFLIGKEVLVYKNITKDPGKNGVSVPARVLGIDDELRLTVEYADGTEENLSTGEVSIVPSTDR